MPTKRMLIDTTHAEETRVVIVTGNKLDDFDVEVELRKQIKSNIYLAKVTRVEPSLQAAFVDFGGNRHGFLAFNEIHPDYYQIPIADREALIAEERAENKDDDDDNDETSSAEGDVEDIGGDDTDELEARRSKISRRNYKIQEVIKRNQILLIQAVKEERGNKGAALTTYISLPGRYCVLMPNTARGGGISRKIANVSDRRRLKSILSELEIPEGVAVIVRTAGSKRTKAEIKRDYDYLMRLWNQVRETTLDSIAPSLVYEEGNLIKRAIRDLYTKDIEEVIIEGNDGYRTAKDFMKLLIPSHAKRVQPYKDEAIPLFHRYQIEGQLDAMHDPVVTLKSGGYIVIGQTEALVAIDVNSGKATRERNIEETAVQTNMEAAEEIARQLRLRDLAGLVVIDFIDMEVNRNQSKVERVMKDSMRIDRARIQMGRISHFGLLEMSRQRLRPSLMESSTEPCPHCNGTGGMRSTESAALSVIRSIEEEGMRSRASAITVHVCTAVALYILNQKRTSLEMIEARYEFGVLFANDDSLIAPNHRIERTVLKQGGSEKINEHIVIEHSNEEETVTEGEQPRKKRRRRTRKRGRGSPENNADTNGNNEASAQAEPNTTSDSAGESGEGSRTPDVSEKSDTGGEDGVAKKRRRGKRGGRRRTRKDFENTTEETAGESLDESSSNTVASNDDNAIADKSSEESSKKPTEEKEKKPRNRTPRRSPRANKTADAPVVESVDAPAPTSAPVSTPEQTSAPSPDPVSVIDTNKAVEIDPAQAKTTVVVVGGEDKEKESDPKPTKRGWWRRSS
jgi:ribonuclease E